MKVDIKHERTHVGEIQLCLHMLTLLLLIFWSRSNCSYLGKFSLTSVQERITVISAPWDLCMEREERNIDSTKLWGYF